MMVLLILAIDVARVWHDLDGWLANAHGVSAFRQRRPAAASQSFNKANAIKPTPARQFNLGTAEIAAGDRERGAAALDQAMRDPRLRADALYNRGTSALAAKAFDSAIRDYTEVLKLRANDAATKRNLEIAQTLKRAMQQQRDRKGAKGPQPQSSKPQQRATGEQPQEKGSTDLDALLRAVQQQEKEELSRMHKGRAEKLRVGW